MADNFNENLSMFLTSCRESALKELTENNSDYRKLLSDMDKFSKIIHDMIPDEYEALTLKYFMDVCHNGERPFFTAEKHKISVFLNKT